MDFVHEYRRLARQGFVPPLTHTCGEEYTVRVLNNDNVVFQCFACGTYTDFGMAEEKAMSAAIDDYYAKRAK